MSIRITPEPDEAERKAILEALAAENRRPAVSEWAAAALPSREEDEP